jgi:uncharacterized protein YcbX
MKKPIGIIREINLYPVKSMMAVPVAEADVYWYGLNGDRKYGFIRVGNPGGFPWLTGRNIPDLVRYQPRFLNPSAPMESPLLITHPTGAEWAMQDKALQARLAHDFGGEVDLLQLKRGTWDAHPVSFMTTQSVATLSEKAGKPIDPRRFRINFVIETDELGEEPELNWLEKSMHIGDRSDAPLLYIGRRIQRCVMVNIDPDTAERDSAILKAVSRYRDSCAGIYANIQSVGKVRVGDTLYLKE